MVGKGEEVECTKRKEQSFEKMGKLRRIQGSDTRARVHACRRAIPGQGFKQVMPGQALHLLDLGHLDSTVCLNDF